MEKIRIMVVDDSAFMRQTIKGMIEADHLFRVVATARNGLDALKKLTLYHPDAITLDIVMDGGMDGLQVLQKIMAAHPTPTLMVSGASEENANYVIEAISSGAFDFICKPSGKIADIERIERELQMKLRQAVYSKKPAAFRAGNMPGQKIPNEIIPMSPVHPLVPPIVKNPVPTSSGGRISLERCPIIFLGTSTGGPKALQSVIPGLKKDLPAPVLVVQHMPSHFTRSLADRLNHLSKLTVSEAQEGEVLKNGHVYIAPGGRHLQLLQKAEGLLTVHLLDTPPMHGVKPAVDITLESFLRIKDRSFILTIMTGMGRDGADGVAALKNSGADVFTIAEAEETCVVFGMPKAAIETGKIDQVVSLTNIADTINRQFDHGRDK